MFVGVETTEAHPFLALEADLGRSLNRGNALSFIENMPEALLATFCTSWQFPIMLGFSGFQGCSYYSSFIPAPQFPQPWQLPAHKASAFQLRSTPDPEPPGSWHDHSSA